jgi:hemoglobin-like flavoprotein
MLDYILTAWRHPVTPEDIACVQSTWAKLIPQAEEAATLFYDRLFEKHPDVKPLFKGDMDEQGRRIMGMIHSTVMRLDDLDPLRPMLRESGVRHMAYGVGSADYDKMADALYWTLEQVLGDEFTPEVRLAWIAVFNELAGVMQGKV